MTNKERILNYIKENKSITSKECYEELGILTLQESIRDLKRDGIGITTIREDGINRYGEKCHWMRYFLCEN